MQLLCIEKLETRQWKRPVSFSIDAGEMVLLLGRNGAGKTALLNTIAGLEPVHSGRIVVNGEDITSLNAQERCRRGVRIGLEGRQVFKRLSVEKNLRLGAYVERNRGKVNSMMKTLFGAFPDLQKQQKRLAGVLSGGQQTQLSIARALVANPRVLMLDEPLLGLDFQSVRAVVNILTHIRNQRGAAIIVSEHNAAVIRTFSERVLIMMGGEITFDGSLADARKAGHLGAVLQE